jgi:hypothetical protein
MVMSVGFSKILKYFNVPQINEKFQLHQIGSKGRFKKYYCTFHHPISTLKNYFFFCSVDPKEYFRPLNRNLFFNQKWQKTVGYIALPSKWWKKNFLNDFMFYMTFCIDKMNTFLKNQPHLMLGTKDMLILSVK